MTTPNIKDTSAVAGSHPGTATQEELRSKVSLAIDSDRTLSDAASKVMSAAEWHLNSLSDCMSSPKYPIDPEVSFLAGGAISVNRSRGTFLLSSVSNEQSKGAISFDHSKSNFYSNLNTTTLGSLNIDTVDGYELNQTSTTRPSTNFSPTKPWTRKLFPSLSVDTLMSIGILGIIVVTLKNISGSNNSENFTSKSDVDMSTIIVDNQIIEDQFYGGS